MGQPHNKKKTPPAGRRALGALVVLYLLVSVGLMVYNWFFQPGMFFGRAVAAPLFLPLIPLLMRLGLKPGYKLYCMLMVFLLYAYSFGCVWGGFTHLAFHDKISHFLSGIVFTILGYCLYFKLMGPQPRGIRHKAVISSSYAFCLSATVGVLWEVMEFVGYITTGLDAQRHMETGVFDTMQDLISCLLGSLLSVAGFVLYIHSGKKLLTAAVTEDFYLANVAGKNEADAS